MQGLVIVFFYQMWQCYKRKQESVIEKDGLEAAEAHNTAFETNEAEDL